MFSFFMKLVAERCVSVLVGLFFCLRTLFTLAHSSSVEILLSSV